MNITIVGGGFGGVKAALELAKNKKNKITLVTDKPDFQYYPALYGAATGRSHLESWVPLAKIFAGKKNVTIKIDLITSIHPDEKKVTSGVSGTDYPYDTCILALGSVTTYFGIEGLDRHSYGIKSAEEIEKLKRHLYEDIIEHHVVDKRYVVIGAGPTGVELAGALGSYITRLCKMSGMKKTGVHIDLIEAAPRVLPKMSEQTSRRVHRRLQDLGVKVQTGKAVESATADEVIVSGKPIKTQTVIWTSGVTNHPFYKVNEDRFTFAPNGRIAVDAYMLAMPNVYVIGDNAATPYTGLAQTALHDALFVTANIEREQHGLAPKVYKPVKPPVVVPVGENWAAFEWYGVCLYGWIAALLRRAADFIGYSDMLPLGQALGVWRASLIEDDEIEMPQPKN